MKHLLFIALIFSWSFITFSQTAWTWTPLADMPVRVSNNAVAYGSDGANGYVYTFGGIDSTKAYTGINNRAFHYAITTDTWEEIAPIPFELENIAAAASTVNNMVYIIGGYHVLMSGAEITSNEVIRYNPMTNTYLSNGAEIPVPIDDQVQCVWRDSLIFVITGWSSTSNVNDVQIYDPATDSWTVATPVPEGGQYEVFGGSGEIIGDTIYYYGGAANGFNFPAQQRLRKGVINAENPSEIEWSMLDDGPNKAYRSAAITYGTSVFWVGGAATSYNYNGVAYNGTGGVAPLAQIMRYNHSTATWYAGEGAPYGIMDLRGAAQISPTEWIICGGMEAYQSVTNRTFLLTYDPVVGSLEEHRETFDIIHHLLIVKTPAKTVTVFGVDGKQLWSTPVTQNTVLIPESFNGIYLITVQFENGAMATKKVHL